jgi:hypothetical protein
VKRAVAAGALSDELSPVDVMLAVMRGASEEEVTPRQYQAAVDVAPYVCPRLSAVAVATTGELTLADLIAMATQKKPPMIEHQQDSHSALIERDAEYPPLAQALKPVEKHQFRELRQSCPLIRFTITKPKNVRLLEMRKEAVKDAG